jgi:hypothetical protein
MRPHENRDLPKISGGLKAVNRVSLSPEKGEIAPDWMEREEVVKKKHQV